MRIVDTRAADGALEVVLALEPGDPVRTSQARGLVDAVCEAAPGIRRHRCTSPESGFLVSELPDTEIAHLFEHLTLELMTGLGAPPTVSGSTDWDFSRDGHGVYRITLAGAEADLAERASVRALAIMQEALGGRASRP